MIELWGGPECTINRVAGQYRDQFAETGHDRRPADLDRFVQLGVRALRYPVLWEQVSPDDPAERDWTRSDPALARLKASDIRPIVGLVHHGSGPRYTDLLDPAFATGLARHAAAVAERYPWVTEWTPVNEPVTTARFSALYGHWYPHHHDERSFWTALLNQIDAVRLAMHAVRRVDAAAKLVQTEDLGRTYATVAVRDQAAFDNMRRWMSWDLLCGRVGPLHPFWNKLCGFGLEDRLRIIADDPCPPDIVGVNHYLTSDRFLDHRVERYPSASRGGNGHQQFVDIEAARVVQPPTPGLEGALREAWARYGIPIAVTEVHNGSTREEQMRWMSDAWTVAQALQDEGVDIRAVTSWALLGNRGWNTLLTAPGRYESGAYDVSGGAPRATALVPLLERLSRSEASTHPVLRGRGWWQRAIRLHHPAISRPASARDHATGLSALADAVAPPILIVGANGMLGGALAAACRHRDLRHVATDRTELDLLDPVTIDHALDRHRPWAVVNAAGWADVDGAEREPEACFGANAIGAMNLARQCAARGIPTSCFSSDLVFGGMVGHAYVEADRPAPLSVYGHSKAAMEAGVMVMEGDHLVIRTAAVFSPFDPHNFAVRLVRAVADGAPFEAARDRIVTPTYLPDLCNALLDLVIDGEVGLWHLTNGESVRWADLGCRILRACGRDTGHVRSVPGGAPGRIAPRPVSVALASTKGMLLPSLDDAIARFAIEMARSGQFAEPSMA